MLNINDQGHARPLTNYVARLAKMRLDLHISLLTTNAFFDRITKELARSFDEGDAESAQRIR